MFSCGAVVGAGVVGADKKNEKCERQCEYSIR